MKIKIQILFSLLQVLQWFFFSSGSSHHSNILKMLYSCESRRHVRFSSFTQCLVNSPFHEWGYPTYIWTSEYHDLHDNLISFS
jgi:hypothetical protein